MSYSLGVDIGTTFTAAAILRDGRATTVSLGDHTASIPSVVFAQPDGTFLLGDAAVRRGVSEPERLGREFKRRLGDTQQILLGGAPYSAELLTSRLLRRVVDDVVTREGSEPDQIVLAHPANWGQFKTDLLGQAVQMAGLSGRVRFITEPEAVATAHAAEERLETNQIVVVYDLGGGTFDTAVLRKTDVDFEFLGERVGIERLGGIDFDAAVFGHVSRALDGYLDTLDPEDKAVILAVNRLQAECVTARESLSSDTSAVIAVLLPGLSTQVRLTRLELESMLRPVLVETVSALRRALASADVRPEQLDGVLLAGGSSRTPLVSQLLIAELGRPVLLTSDPVHAIALGAAYSAGTTPAGAEFPTPTGPPPAAERQLTAIQPSPLPVPGVDPSPQFDVPPAVAAPAYAAGHVTSPPQPDATFVPPLPAPIEQTSSPNTPRPARLLLVGAMFVAALALVASAVVLTRESNPETEVATATPRATTWSTAIGNAADPTRIPIVATVDAGSMVAVAVTNPIVGTDQYTSVLTPSEFVSARTIGGNVRAFIDLTPTSNVQFYDFATFASASSAADPLGTWAEIVPASWSTISPGSPTSFADLGLGERDPVVGVSFAAAEAYCTYALKRLPTEVEWELAAVPGLIDVASVQNWVAEPEAYGLVPERARVLRGSFGTENLPVYFRTVGETPTNLANAGLRCAADGVIEIPRPSGELLYSREFSGADEARDWPDLHDPARPESVFGYHAPDVFHIEVGESVGVTVVADQTHSDGTEVSADVELRIPGPAEGSVRYGLVALASDSGALTFTVHPQLDDQGEPELAWCVNRSNNALVEQGALFGVSATTSPVCERGGTTAVLSHRNTLTIRFSDGDAEFFIDGAKVDTMFHGLASEGTFGFLAEAFDNDPLLHVHFDNLVVKTS